MFPSWVRHRFSLSSLLSSQRARRGKRLMSGRWKPPLGMDRGEVSVLTRGAQASVVMSDRNFSGGRGSGSRVGASTTGIAYIPPNRTWGGGQCQQAPGPQLSKDAGCLTEWEDQARSAILGPSGDPSPLSSPSSPAPGEAVVLGWEMLPGVRASQGGAGGPAGILGSRGWGIPTGTRPSHAHRPPTETQLPQSPRWVCNSPRQPTGSLQGHFPHIYPLAVLPSQHRCVCSLKGCLNKYCGPEIAARINPEASEPHKPAFISTPSLCSCTMGELITSSEHQCGDQPEEV